MRVKEYCRHHKFNRSVVSIVFHLCDNSYYAFQSQRKNEEFLGEIDFEETSGTRQTRKNCPTPLKDWG